MRVGFFEHRDGKVWANTQTAVNDIAELAQVAEGGDVAVAFLDFTDCTTESRGNLGPAFEALDLLIAINHFHEGSLCYAVEELVERAFKAGQEHERRKQMRSATTTSFTA